MAEGKVLLDELRPDVVILDEAQRIKNWQTKTANAVKKLQSRYAFVLTGTPLENRIDEIYSIVQFLDPDLLGPLFRFNREFYELDEKGRPSGFRNLDELAKRVSSVMLRRRKEDVESELPGRTVKTFFVPMTDTQTRAYEDYDLYVKRLAALAAKRPLTRDEFDRLQKFLACMRMVCDTPYILGDENRDCPKMEEIERLLPDLLEDPERKIIVFSDWVRMLELVREYAAGAGIEFAWHTGSVPQPQRRAEIRRFRADPECRLFLSSESGGVGLNLQVADTVVNMDLPWNPARLEQRIARARSGMVLTPMPPSMRRVLTVMRRKVSASPSPEVVSDTAFACAIVRFTTAGSEASMARRGVGGEAQRCHARVVDAVGRADPDPHPFDPERHRYPVSGSGNTASSSMRV